MTAPRYSVLTLNNGASAVRDEHSGEVMHPAVGPWREANLLYVEQMGLAERLVRDDSTSLVVYDVGLGAGANASAVMTAAAQLGERRRRPLELVSFENDLSSADLAWSRPDAFPFLEPWREAFAQLRQRGRWEQGDLGWTLVEGEVLSELTRAAGPAELILFDPFSPKTNPALWTPAAFAAFHSRCAAGPQGAMLATYSAATPTRVALLLAGFFVGDGCAVGGKSQTTLAATRLELLPKPLDQRWLDRWRRSSSRAPHGEAFTEALEARLKAHPQFGEASVAG